MDFQQTILLRTRIAFLAVLLFALAIISKLVYIQFVQGNQWKEAAEVATIEFRPLKPTRGNIYTSDGSLLATSLPFYRVAFDPCIADEALFQEHLEELSQLLASFYRDKSAQDYQAMLQEARQAKRRYLVLNSRHISHQAKRMMSQWPLFRAGRWQGGVIFEKAEKRFRPFQNMAFRTIGFINEEKYGAGLEYSFDKPLRGVEGSALYQKLAGGSWRMLHNSSATRPLDGYDIETTLDVNLQDVAHSSLQKALEESQAAYGCVIVMEVPTGELKALVNLGQTATGQYQEVYNYAVGSQGTTEPGSSFKLISMLALLEETSLALTDSVDAGSGKFKFHDLTMRDVKSDGHGVITIQEAFEKSSNIGIAKLLDSTFSDKPQQFINYIHKLGLNKPLGFQLAGEGVPLIKSPQSPTWSSVTLPWMSMGYELKLTPLQVLTVYNAVANQGKMIQPIIVKKIKQANRVIKEFSSPVLHKKICSDQTLQKLKAMLEGVVERGTARKFRHGFYKIAGKSGTANKVVDGRYTPATYTSFVGYFPAEAPRYSCIVVIDSPQGASYHYGAQTAAPVVKEIADKLSAKDLASSDYITAAQAKKTGAFPLIKAGYREDLLYLCHELDIAHTHVVPDEWIRAAIQDDILVWRTNANFNEQRVPAVLGMTLKDALFLLENRGLQVAIQGDQGGRVEAQSLPPGTKIAQHKSINLQLR